MPVPTSGSQGELLSAYLDGELAPQERQAVEWLLRDSAEARAGLEQLKAVREGLLALPRRCAPQDLASSISAELEREALLGELRPAGRGEGSSRSAVWSVFAAAAVLAFASLLWWQLDRWGRPTTPDDQLVSAPGGRAAPTLQDLAESLSERSESAKLTEKQALEDSAALARKSADPRWSGAAQPDREGSDAKRGPVPSPLTERLLASASLAQKIEAGVGVETLRTHHFDTESAQLTIECTSDEQRTDVLRTLVKALKDTGAVNLAMTDEVPAGPAFAEGKLGVNYSIAEEKQLIVRLPAQQWKGVLDTVEKSAADARPEMRSGLVVGKGWTSAQTLLAGDAETASLGYFALRDEAVREQVLAEGEVTQEPPPPMLDARQVSAEAAVRDLVGVLLVPGGAPASLQAAGPPTEEQLSVADVSMGIPVEASSEDEGRSVRVAEAKRNEPDGTALDGEHSSKNVRGKEESRATAEGPATQMRVALSDRKTPPQSGGTAPADRGEGTLEAKQADKAPPSGGAAGESAKPAVGRPASRETKAKPAKPAAPVAPVEKAAPGDAAGSAPVTESAGAEVVDKAAPDASSTTAGKKVAAGQPATPPVAREHAALRALGYVDDDAKDAQAQSRDSSLVERRRRALADRGKQDVPADKPASAAPADKPASAAPDAEGPAGHEAERTAGDEAERTARDELLKELDQHPPPATLDPSDAGAEIALGERVSAGRGVASRAREPVMFGFAPDLHGLPTVVIRLRVVPPAVE